MATYNDFTGFSFQPIINGMPDTEKHSSELGFLRVSDGSRYSDNLLPTMKDITAEIPGSDGTYWWKTTNTQLNFTIPIAFDSMSELQMRNLRQIFNGKNLGYLIFDELPFKKYTVKSTGTPNIKFICFEENGKRVYKGEGTLTFTAYYPYAKSVHKYLNQFSGARYSNLKEWQESSGMKLTGDGYDGTLSPIKVVNVGDVEVAPRIYYPISETKILDITLKSNDDVDKAGIKLENITLEKGDTGILLNMETHLAEGYNLNNNIYTRTGKLYNKYIVTGDFFTIPNDGNDYTVVGADCDKIEYEYIYF